MSISVVERHDRFEIVKSSLFPSRPGIRCLQCGKTSWHPVDVKEHYCGFCKVFHDEQTIQDQLRETGFDPAGIIKAMFRKGE